LQDDQETALSGKPEGRMEMDTELFCIPHVTILYFMYLKMAIIMFIIIMPRTR